MDDTPQFEPTSTSLATTGECSALVSLSRRDLTRKPFTQDPFSSRSRSPPTTRCQEVLQLPSIGPAWTGLLISVHFQPLQPTFPPRQCPSSPKQPLLTTTTTHPLEITTPENCIWPVAMPQLVSLSFRLSLLRRDLTCGSFPAERPCLLTIPDHALTYGDPQSPFAVSILGKGFEVGPISTTPVNSSTRAWQPLELMSAIVVLITVIVSVTLVLGSESELFGSDETAAGVDPQAELISQQNTKASELAIAGEPDHIVEHVVAPGGSGRRRIRPKHKARRTKETSPELSSRREFQA